MKPNNPAMKEASKIAILEKVITSGSSKASKVIKIDIVNPIPPSIPAPITYDHFRSFGSVQTPNVTPKRANKVIPNGFPTTKPIIIPNALGWLNPSCQSELIAIHVLAKANNGKIKNATGLCKKCCSL